MDYSEELKKLFVSRGLAKPQDFDDWLTRPQFSGNAVDLALEVITSMVDSEGPTFLREAARRIYRVYRDIREDTVASELGHYYRGLLEQRHGVKIISIDDAIARIHGRVDTIQSGKRQKNKVNPRRGMQILYKTQESLDNYIRSHTTREEVVVIKWTF